MRTATTINGGVGSDVLDGGEGNDMADYAGRFDPVDLDLRAGIAVTDRGSGTRRVRETDNLFSFEAPADARTPTSCAAGRGRTSWSAAAATTCWTAARAPTRWSAAAAATARTTRAGGRPCRDARREANDGARRQGDNIDSSVEDIAGGAARRRLTGNERRNRLFGGGGRDVLTGLGGADTLDGGDGADRLIGGEGGDALIGGAGLDLFLGGDGDDRVDARDGRRDGVRCGPGRTPSSPTASTGSTTTASERR